MVFSFQMTIILEAEPKILVVGAGSGAKSFRCLEPEPEV